MTAHRAKRQLFLLLAVAALLPLLAAVPLLPETLSIRALGFAVDVVVLSVVLAIVGAIPYVRTLSFPELPPVGAIVPASAFIGLAGLSSILSVSPTASAMTLARYMAYIALSVVVAAVAKDSYVRHRLMAVMAAAGTVTAIHGLWQYGHPVAQIGMQEIAREVSTRVFAAFGNPNFYAEYLVLAVSVTVAFMASTRGRTRYIATLMLGLQIVVLLLTYTRGSWLALGVGFVLAGLMIDARLAAAPLLIAGLAVPLLPGVVERLATIVTTSGSAGFRIKLWKVALVAISRRPLFGYGLGRFYDAFRDAVISRPGLAFGYAFYGAHNSYLQIAAETGVLGAAAFLAMVVNMCSMGFYYNARLRDLSARLENAALTAGLIAFAINALTSNAFQHPQGAVFFFVLAGLQAGIGADVWDEAARPAPARREPRLLRGSRVVGALSPVLRKIRAALASSVLAKLIRGFFRMDGRVVWRSALVGLVVPGARDRSG